MSKFKVWIDPGHGGNDSGAVGVNSRYEKDDNLVYALELERQFIAQGFDVVMTRKTDVTMSLENRTKLERDNKCNLAIACHRNGSNNPSANGFEIWVHSNAPQSFIDWGIEIANEIEILGMKKRNNIGVFRGYTGNPKSDYYANSGTTSPSMLIEMGFMSNENDNRIFDEKLTQLCQSIVKSSCNFLKAQYIPVGGKPVPPLQNTVPMDEYRKLLKERDELADIIADIIEKIKSLTTK